MKAEDFAAYYEQVHGVAPFPWQRDLVSQIVERRVWPSLVDVPTGLGKTSMLDVAVFLSALDAEEPFNRRVGRRRIFFVVDRRIVVDQAAAHAQRLVASLGEAQRTAPTSVAGEVALRLCQRPGCVPSELPAVVRMRGGATWDAAWLERPDLRGIVTGTVDQVGSRLFFRGYGVSPRRWPIDAALVGTDSLILVDEAHLATALTTTLDAARLYDRPSTAIGVPSPVVVQLTATPQTARTGWVPEFDEEAHLAVPEAARRLQASKTLYFSQVKKGAIAKALADAAAREAGQAGARVLVVCNTIDRARDVHDLLCKTLPKTLLLMGRSRPYDREGVVDEVLDLFGAGHVVTEESAVLVATQTVEVGIDLDATALVTECASWDALIQRMGRVNRFGCWDSASVIVISDGESKPPVYGSAQYATAEFLRQQVGEIGTMDASPLALRRLKPPSSAFQARPVVPVLLPPHLDAWTRTGPAPANDAPLDPYLHGLDSGVAPVSVAWRDGLVDADGSPVSPDEAAVVIDTVPVRAEESVDVPIAAARRWLLGKECEPVSDVEDDDDWVGPFGDEPRNLVWRRASLADGTARWEQTSAGDLRPGDSIVVPTERGGLDRFGWNPICTTPVRDVAELAALSHDRPLLRLDAELPHRLGLTEPDPELWDAVYHWQTADDPDERNNLARSCEILVRAWLTDSPTDAEEGTYDPWSRKVDHDGLTRRDLLRKAMVTARAVTVVSRRTPNAVLLPVAVMQADRRLTDWRDLSDDTPDGTAHLGTRVTLRRHGQAVAARADEIAVSLRLPEELRTVVVDAARWHDVGKADERFQAMLFDGDSVSAAIADEPLAKSGMAPGESERFRAAYRRSGLPRAARHEAWSLALVSAYLGRSSDVCSGDTDLLLHLVASHHGHARPLLPPVVETGSRGLVAQLDTTMVATPLPKTVDLNLADRFQQLNRQYGRWGLALLESIVRCADMTVSGEGS